MSTLKQQLFDLKETEPDVFQAIHHFLYEVMPKLAAEYRGLDVDTKLPKQFAIRYHNGDAFINVEPRGKIGAMQPEEIVRKYKVPIMDAAVSLREAHDRIGWLKTIEDGYELGRAIEEFVQVLIKAKGR